MIGCLLIGSVAAPGPSGMSWPELIRYVRTGDTVRVASMDRLGRDTRDLYNLVAELMDQGAAVEFLNENYHRGQVWVIAVGFVEVRNLGRICEI